MRRIPEYNVLQRWFIRLCFRLTLVTAAGLAVFVLIAPLLTLPDESSTCVQICRLFAEDDLLRKTTVASALGLWLTAVICFRVREPEYWYWNRRRYETIP